jgi:hypothetical protein
MTSESANGHRAETPVEFVPEQVAELAAEISEAQTPSRRRRLARQLPQLAAKSGRASVRGLQSGGQASVRGLQSARQAPLRGLKAGSQASLRRLRTGGQSAWTGLQAGGQLAGQGLQSVGRRLTGQVLDMAPKIPIRNIAALRDQYPGRPTEELADALIDAAARASGGVGAAVGAAAAVPFIPTAPVELGVETLALVAIELKLIAELHEVYGVPAPGGRTERMLAYVSAWANRRGVRITGSGLAIAVGSPLWRRLERRLLAKAGQSTLALAPLLMGAATAAGLNYRETRRLGNQVRDDLRRNSGPAAAITS